MTELLDGIPQPVCVTPEEFAEISELYVKATYFETINSGTTSGTVPKPAGGGADVSFVMDEWGVDTDALVTTMDGGKPTFRSPVDAGGNPITSTFDTAGNFNFSATPVPAADHAIVYVYKCFLKNFDADESLFETEIGAGGDHSLLTNLPWGDSGHTMDIDLDMDTHKITNVVDPVDPQDAATMAFAESVVDKAQTVTVAVSGGDFTDIKTAADSITDSSITKRYVIQIWPGYYPVGATISLPPYCSLKGMGGPTDVVLWYTGADPIVEFDNGGSDSVVQNATFFVPPLSGQSPTVIKQHNGRHAILTCFLLMQTGNNNAKATAIDIDDGSLVLQAMVAYYTFGGSQAGASTHEIIKLNGGDLGMASCDWRIDINDVDDDVIFISDSSDESAVFWVSGNTSTRMNLNNAAYSGTAYWYKANGDVADRNIMSNTITLKGNGSGTGYIYYVDTTSGTATINSASNQIVCKNFANNYFSMIASGDTLNTFFDVIDAVDGNTGAGTYNYANSPAASVFAAHQVQLDNNNGNAIEFPTGQLAGEAKNYRFDMGCGSLAGGDLDGTVEFGMDACIADTKNLFVFDLGNVYFASPTQTNDFAIKSYNGLATYQFLSAFGGWSNPEYGWQLQRVSGAEATGKSMFFDNQTPISDALRSIDFRIDGTDILTIENDQTVAFPLRNITAPTGLIINGYGSITSSTVFNLFDITEFTSVNTNAATAIALNPGGTSPTSVILCKNDPSSSDYGLFEHSLSGSIAKLATWRLATGTGITEFRIGEMPSAFFGVGVLDSLTTIDFYFAGAIEVQLQPDTLIFNNGAVDTQIDWGTSGELGLQVATNDILRLTATQVQCIQDLVMSDAQNIILNTATGTKIGTATTQKIGFWNATPVVQPSAYTPSNVSVDRSFDADSTTVDELADVLGTLIADLQSTGLVG